MCVRFSYVPKLLTNEKPGFTIEICRITLQRNVNFDVHGQWLFASPRLTLTTMTQIESPDL